MKYDSRSVGRSVLATKKGGVREAGIENDGQCPDKVDDAECAS